MADRGCQGLKKFDGGQKGRALELTRSIVFHPYPIRLDRVRVYARQRKDSTFSRINLAN